MSTPIIESAPGPRASILVVTFNNKAHFPTLKAALEAQTERDFELIILDNASEPTERPHPEDLPEGAILIRSIANLGFAAANNLAARAARAEHLICLNPDAFPEPDWLAKLLEAARLWPYAASIGSTQIRADDLEIWDGLGDMMHAFGLPYRSGFGRKRLGPAQAGSTFSACAAAALYRRAAFFEAGGFDERFFCYGEDVDLGFKLRLLGYDNIQAAGAVVRHLGGGSSGRRSAFAIYHGTRNRFWTFVQNMPGVLFFALLPAHLALSLFVLAWSAFRGSFLPTWAGLRDGLAGLPEALEARRSIQSRKRARVGQIARALTWSPLAVVTRRPVLRQLRR